MKTAVRLSCFFVLVAVSVSATGLRAEPNSGGVVAVLDVKAVFDEHQRFQTQVNQIKQEIEGFEQSFVKQRDALIAEGKRLGETFQVGTPDYKRTEADLARRASDLEVQRQLKQKEIIEKEARAYYDAYQEIIAEVAAFADQNGIALVLRYEGSAIDKDNRGDVIKGVNRYVVFQRNRDLTSVIIERVNRRTAAVPAPGQTLR